MSKIFIKPHSPRDHSPRERKGSFGSSTSNSPRESLLSSSPTSNNNNNVISSGSPTSNSHNPLFVACMKNEVNLVDMLVQPSNLEATQGGYTPLHYACLHSNLETIKLLISKGANVNAAINKTTVLHTASEKGVYPIVAYLIKHGANVNAVDKDGNLPVHVCSQKEKRLDLFMLLYVSNLVRGVHVEGMLSMHILGAEDTFTNMIVTTVSELSNKKALDISGKEYAFFEPDDLCNFEKLKTLNLSRNCLSDFPSVLKRMRNLTSLNLSHNEIKAIPQELTEMLPNLEKLNLSFNKLDDVPSEVAYIADVDVSHNPLAAIPHMFRDDNSKVLFYVKFGGKKEQWNQVKLMLVGHEGVGKTTFLKALQGQQAPAAKNPNVSTNGVDISHVELPAFSSEGGTIKSRFTRKKEKVVLNVWDFGGQAVFHSTHRFFLTSSAIYLIVYNMADENTHSRLEHWMKQITSIVDTAGGSMPIFLVGTHADKLSQAEKTLVMSRIIKTYPVSTKHTGIQGHFAVSLSTKGDDGVQELKEAITRLAKEHPKIGLGHVKVPAFLLLIKDKLQEVAKKKKYLEWQEYKELCQATIITEDFPIVEWTCILQELGVLVWNNTAKLRDIVIIDPQWLADALAGVVTMVNQGSVVRSGGVALRSKLYGIMKTKIAEEALFPIIFSLLERFEIILRMRNYYSGVNTFQNADGASSPTSSGKQEEDIKYFVPSLLLPYDPKNDLAHPVMQFWRRIGLKGFTTLKRRFTWNFYPANFFPRLLLRLMHMQVSLLGSWVDAAVLMSQDQGHYAFVHLFPQGSSFVLEATVMQEPHDKSMKSRDALISELAYAITRLDREMWDNDTPVQHDVVVCTQQNPSDPPNVISFGECMNMVAKDERQITVGGKTLQIEHIAPDLSCCNEIHHQSLSGLTKIGEGGFGVVFKATLRAISVSNKESVEVAIKEMLREKVEGEESEELKKLYEFQHEMLIMSKVSEHKNLVQLYGVIKSPLSLVMEYVPCGDLHKLLNDPKVMKLGWKWRLKMAIDIARGMSHLHKQTPPICHSDLRAPNIFVASLDEEADVVGKVADFGLAQQIFPFSSQVLGNIAETAPETWGDEGITKGAMYDERSDVFSYAIILWFLFGSYDIAPADPSAHVALHPYGHLKDAKGRALNNWSLRNKIREGERLPIVGSCPAPLRTLMEECWQFDPTLRPFFPIIAQRLQAIYASMFGENDKYLTQDVSTVNAVNLPRQADNLTIPLSNNLSVDNWYPKPLDLAEKSVWTIVSLILVDGDIWAGTNTGAILLINAKTGKLVHIITLQKSGRVLLLQAGRGCIWASCESEKISIINSQIKYRISDIDNEHPVVCMALSYHHAGPTTPVVWVADTKGFVSLWDLTTAQKYCRFQVIGGVNPPVVKAMSVLHEHMWMAVGADIVAIETQTLQRIVKATGHGRLNGITAVPSSKQVWTCSKDGWIKAWELTPNEDKSSSTRSCIKNVKSVKHSAEVKFVKDLNNTVPPLSRGIIVTGDFNGKLMMWNSELEPIEFPMPPEMKDHALQCAMDSGDYGLWLGTMNNAMPLMRYHCVPTDRLMTVGSDPNVSSSPIFLSLNRVSSTV